MHEAAFAAAHIPATYTAELVSPDSLLGWVSMARTLGYQGLNVTIPHKEAIVQHLDSLDRWAADIGAVNTIVCRSEGWRGHNTDAPGFQATVRSLGLDLVGKSAVVLGAGGSAKAVVHALIPMGACITILARRLAPASGLSSRFGDAARADSLESEAAAGIIEASDIVVNCTPIGMTHLYQSPLPPSARLSSRTVVIDLVYGRVTPLVELARARGCIAVDGIEMLVQQGAEAFRLWTGIEPNTVAMRAACRAALSEVA